MHLRISAFTIILISLTVQNGHAFNWRKCKSFIQSDRSLTGGGWFSSSTSFFSSTGECAMIGKADHDAKVFIAHNKEKMLEDFARGRGEYACAFAAIYGCDSMSQQLLVVSVKENYINLLELQGDGEFFNFLREEISKIESSGGSCKTGIHSSSSHVKFGNYCPGLPGKTPNPLENTILGNRLLNEILLCPKTAINS